jgi:DnaJ-class molecular chaperone
MNPPDPYRTLGVARHATAQQIAHAHRQLAKLNHPDLSSGADATMRMRRINQAWQILSNPVQRAAYDQRDHAGAASRAGHWAAGANVRPANAARTSAAWHHSPAAWGSVPQAQVRRGGRANPGTTRPQPAHAQDSGFLASGWAALLAGGLVLLITFLAAVAGNVT